MSIEKYKSRTPSELRDIAAKKDSTIGALKGDINYLKAAMTSARMLRGGSTAAVSVAVGYLEEQYPSTRSIGGLPIGLRHLVAAGGVLATGFFSFSESFGETVAPDISEGVAMAGLVPVFNDMGAYISRS